MRRPQALPLRWRLTFLYTGILALFLIALDLFVYAELRRALLQGQQAILSANATTLMDLLNSDNAPPGANQGRRLSPGVVYQLYDAQGVVMATSNGGRAYFPALPAPTPLPTPAGRQSSRPADRSGPPAGRLPPDFRTMQQQAAGDQEAWLVLTLPVGGRGRMPGILQVALSLAPLNSTLLDLRRILGGGSLGVLVLALVSGPAVAARALQPLRRMADTAERLASGDLSQRTALGHGKDEVGQLAHSLDNMAANLERSFAAQLATEDRLRRFAADASHELRTPLTALRGYVDVLLRGAKDDPVDAEHALEAMQREALRMEQLTRDLLDLTRLDASLAGAPTALQLADLVDAAIADLAWHDVSVSWERREALTVSADPAALRRAVSNLLQNARRYSPAGSPVTVSLVRDGMTAVLAVSDRGIGIAPDDLPHIFERFYRGDSARSRATGGSGLGLAIVEAIVHANGGSAMAASELGRGSTFTIRLPAARPMALPAAPQRESVGRRSGGSGVG